MTTRIVKFADGFSSSTEPDTTGYLLSSDVGDDLAPLDENGLLPIVHLPTIPEAKLPQGVFNVRAFPTFAGFPPEGLDHTIYISKDDNIQYRWSGSESVYLRIGQYIANTEDVPEALGNLYYTATRAKADVVVNTMDGDETNQAPSVAAAKDAINYKVIDSLAGEQTDRAPSVKATKAAIIDRLTGTFANNDTQRAPSVAATISYIDGRIIDNTNGDETTSAPSVNATKLYANSRVVNVLTGNETDKAPSVASIKAAINNKLGGPASTTAKAIPYFTGGATNTVGQSKLLMTDDNTILGKGGLFLSADGAVPWIGLHSDVNVAYAFARATSSATRTAGDGEMLYASGKSKIAMFGSKPFLSSIQGQDGLDKDITLFNFTGANIVIRNEHASVATAAERISTGTGQDFILRPGTSVDISFVSGTVNRWILRGGASSSTIVDSIFTLTATDIANQYIDLSHKAERVSRVKPSGFPEQVIGTDYDVSVVAGVTRITFYGDMLELVAGDSVFVTYSH